MRGTYLGPSFDPDAVAADLDHAGRPHTRFTDRVERDRRIAQHLADGDVVAVFEGGMEFGPRALGHRSILADARSPAMQLVLNEKVKGRESFRPFAPAVLADCAGDWFDLDAESPYMVFTVSVRADRRLAPDEPAPSGRTVLDQVKDVRSTIPAVTHVDGSARVQTVDVERFPSFHGILTAFDDLTGCTVLVNTSFNVRGEPIVCTPEDAYRCFMTTGIDWLVLEDCLLDRREQPDWSDEPAPIELD